MREARCARGGELLRVFLRRVYERARGEYIVAIGSRCYARRYAEEEVGKVERVGRGEDASRSL